MCLVSRRSIVKGALGLAGLGLLPAKSTAARSRPHAADYVIVGAGVHGAGLAWELARRGARVHVLEATRIASGASGGIGERGVRSNGRDARQLPLMAIAQQRWRDLARAFGDRRIFRRVGHLHLIESEADLPMAEAQARQQEASGVRTRLLARDELHRLEPDLAEGVIAALYAPDDGASDHDVTTRALARAARRHGAHITRGAGVVGVEVAAGRVAAVVTARGLRVAVGRELLITANAGSAELLASGFGLDLPLFNVLPQALVTAPVRTVAVHHVIGHVRRRLAAKTLPGRRLMITGGWLGRFNDATGRGETIDRQVAGNLAEAVAVYPGLSGVRLTRAAADRIESVTPDLLPIIDRLPGVTNVLIAAGFSGNGWAPSPAVVALVTEWLLGGTRPDVLAPFGLGRFTSP